MKNRPTIFFMVAGETSGDLHGARLMSELKVLFPNSLYYGIGGERMIQQGLHSLIDIKKINVVGFWEVAKKYGMFKKLLRYCAEMMSELQPDAFIPIDYPGFNERLSASAQKLEIPVLWYIAPQLWAWGEHRAKKLRTLVTKLFVVFPFEVDFFAKHGINATFVGHPLLDDEEFDHVPDFDKRDKNLVALFPGSRQQEIHRHGKLLLDTANIISKNRPNIHFEIALARGVEKSFFTHFLPKDVPIEFTKSPRDLMKRAACGLTKTGTTTLECALLGMPQVMYYKTSRLSYLISKNLIRLNSISLPNIILNNNFISEKIQYEATPDQLANEILALMPIEDNQSHLLEISRKSLTIREILGDKGASKQTAWEIFTYLQQVSKK